MLMFLNAVWRAKFLLYHYSWRKRGPIGNLKSVDRILVYTVLLHLNKGLLFDEFQWIISFTHSLLSFKTLHLKLKFLLKDSTPFFVVPNLPNFSLIIKSDFCNLGLLYEIFNLLLHVRNSIILIWCWHCGRDSSRFITTWWSFFLSLSLCVWLPRTNLRIRSHCIFLKRGNQIWLCDSKLEERCRWHHQRFFELFRCVVDLSSLCHLCVLQNHSTF